MKRIRLIVYLYTLFMLTLPLQGKENLQFEQLPPAFSLRTLQRVCQQPNIKKELAGRYQHQDGVRALHTKLRHELRAHMLTRSLQLEKKMAYFFNHHTTPHLHFPNSCPALPSRAWQAVTTRQQEMLTTAKHLSNTVTLRWRENTRILLSASYELMFIHHVLRKGRWNRPRSRNWQHPPYWSRDVGRIKQLAFPPIYPIDLGKMEFGYPRQRLVHLYDKFPLLRWRSMHNLDIRGTTLAHKIFELAFVNGHHEGILQRFEYDFARKLRPLMARVADFSNDVDTIKIKTIKGKELVLNTGQINNLRALQFYFMFDLQRDIEQYIDYLDDNTIDAVAQLIDHTYVDWASTQQHARTNACHGKDFEIEEYRAVLWSLINNYTKEDSLDLLAAFCHPSWTRTPVRMTEAWSQALYGALFIAGLLSSNIRPLAVPLASTTAALSFLMRSVRGVRSLQLERSLLLLDVKAENNRIYNNLFNIAAIPVSFWGLQSAARAFTNKSWNFFVPFHGIKNRKGWVLSLDFITSFGVARYTDAKSHLDRNINPLTSKNYMLNSLDNLLGASVRSRAIYNSDTIARRIRNTATLSLTYALFNIYVQNMYFLFLRDDITIENHKFNNMWGAFHSAPRNILDWTLWHYASSKVSSGSKPIAFAIGGLMNIARFGDGWQKKTWYANSKLAYLKEDKSFLEAFADINLAEYLEPWKIATIVNKEITPPSLKEIKSLEALLRIYSDKNTQTHLLIDVERFYREAMLQE